MNPLVTDAALGASYPAQIIGHGQHGEDRLLENIFADTADGVCMEVGAFDGIVGSATYAFELRDWQTILVEPQPELAAAIARSRRGRLFAVAAGACNGEVWLVPHPTDSAQTSVTPLPPDGKDPNGQSIASIPMRTMDSILMECGVSKVDFATIDVEGAELAVLQGWDLDRWRPRVIILEDNSHGLDYSLIRYLAAKNYVCFTRTGVNDWYARRDDRQLSRPWQCAVRKAWRHWRRLRHGLRQITPSWLKGVLRLFHLAGE